MDKYSYNDVIIDPEDPRVEVGAEYYFGDNVGQLLYGARTGWETEVLRDVCKATYTYAPFYNGRSSFSCIIRKKESSYAERQAKWLADNDIKVGDYVRVTGKADSLEDGWQTLWNPDMDKSVGKVGTVSYISANSGECGIEIDVPDVGPYFYPYFVLEKVEKKYMPFDLSSEKDRDFLRGKWVKGKKTDYFYEYQITKFNKTNIETVIDFGSDGVESSSSLFEDFVFLDGTPCGKLVEVKNDKG